MVLKLFEQFADLRPPTAFEFLLHKALSPWNGFGLLIDVIGSMILL